MNFTNLETIQTPAKEPVHLYLETKGRKSKTYIVGLPPASKELLKTFKKKFCTSGAIKTADSTFLGVVEGTIYIELFGDHRLVVKNYLLAELGYEEYEITVHGA